jgi:hypothetical protein
VEFGGTEEGLPPGTELGVSAEPLVPVFPDVPLPGVTPAQNDATLSLPAAFWRFLKATLLVLMCPPFAMNARHRPNFAAPVASGPTAFALFALWVPVSPASPEDEWSEGTDSPTCVRALWTADCAGEGRLPVAAAAPVAVRASAGMAMARAFVPKRLEIMRVLSVVVAAATGVSSAAVTTATSASRRTSSSPVAGAFAALTSAASWAYPGGASSGSTEPAKSRSAVSPSIGCRLMSEYRSSGDIAPLHLEGKIISELGGQST